MQASRRQDRRAGADSKARVFRPAANRAADREGWPRAQGDRLDRLSWVVRAAPPLAGPPRNLDSPAPAVPRPLLSRQSIAAPSAPSPAMAVNIRFIDRSCLACLSPAR